MSSEGPKAPHLRLAEHPSLRFARVSAHPTLGTPRFRSASLGVTAFAVMLSGGAASPAVETSRPIGTFTHHEPYTQCVASDVRSFLQSFARGGCGLPAQSAESAGYHLERSRRRSERLDTAEHSSVQFKTVHTGTTVEIPRFRFATLGMTEQCTIHNYSARSCCHVERRGARPAVETSRHCGTFAITIHAGSRKYDRRDSSTMPGIKAKRPNCFKQFGRFASRCRLA